MSGFNVALVRDLWQAISNMVLDVMGSVKGGDILTR